MRSSLVADVHRAIGRPQLLRPVLRLERQPCGLEVLLGGIDARGAAERRTRNVDLNMPEPDAGRALAGEADAADVLAVFANGVEAVQDGRIFIERINEPFLAAGGSADEFSRSSWPSNLSRS
jgi:hypothetical protein